MTSGKRSAKTIEVNIKYKEQISGMFPVDKRELEILLKKIIVKEIQHGTRLLSAGEVAEKIFFVLRGCLRSYFIKDSGAEITSQFFIEKQMVSSFESAATGEPSRSYIEAIEDSIIGHIGINELLKINSKCPSLRDHFNLYLASRLIYYMNQHASFILDSPEQRYKRLVKESPGLISRLPQQYIASYLGITPVSLSRIRTRIKKQTNKK